MAIDPNIALQVGQGVQPFDPLGMAGKVVSLQNAQVNNRLLNTNADQAGQNLAISRQKALGAIAGSALSLYDPANPATVRNLVDGLHMGIEGAVKTGTLDAPTAQTLMQGIASTKGADDLVARVKQFALLGIDPNAALSRVGGANANMTNGQAVQPGVVRDPLFGGGFTPAGQPVQQYPSRSELIGRVTGDVGPKGEPTQVPLATVTPPSLGGPAVSGVMGTGRLPPGLLKQPPPPTTGATTTGLGPQQTSALGASGTTAAAKFNDISDNGTKAVSQRAALQDMLAKSDQFGTGIGQQYVKNAQSVLVRLGANLGVDPTKIRDMLAANESFDKIAATIQDAQGAGSDARLAVVQAANPSSSLSPDGIKLIINNLIGNADYLQARAKLASEWPDKSDHSGFEASIRDALDPRVFQYNRIPAEAKSKLVNSLPTDKAKADFIAAYQFAKGKGLLP